MDNDPDSVFIYMIKQILFFKGTEVWLAIFGGSLYVWYKSGATTKVGKAVEAGISCIMAISLGPVLVEQSQYPSTLVHFSIAVVGFALLDLISSIVADRNEVKEILLQYARKILGVNK